MASNEKSKYKVGDIVYLHAHAKKDKNIFLLCHGCVTRLPTTTSPVFKITILKVCTTGAGKIDRYEMAKELLYMKIPCKPDHIFGKDITDFMKLAYDTNSWVSISNEETLKLKKLLENKEIK